MSVPLLGIAYIAGGNSGGVLLFLEAEPPEVWDQVNENPWRLRRQESTLRIKKIPRP